MFVLGLPDVAGPLVDVVDGVVGFVDVVGRVAGLVQLREGQIWLATAKIDSVGGNTRQNWSLQSSYLDLSWLFLDTLDTSYTL